MLKIEYLGDRIPNLLLNDFKHNRTFSAPLTIDYLIVVIHDSFPNIHFVNPHQINKLSVKGTYCNCNFDNLKIANMDFDVMTGALSVEQNSAYPYNKVSVQTPAGDHCISADVVNMNSEDCTNNPRTVEEIHKRVATEKYCTSSGFV
jgi:hypothetical protein